MSTYDPSNRIILAAQELATRHHAPYDPSHDIHHVSRVTNLALSIAKSLSETPSSTSHEGPPLDFLVVHLAALFHDLLDSKYLPPLLPGEAPPTPRSRLDPFWAKFDSSEDEVAPERQRLVEKIVENVSYSKEVKKLRGELGGITEWHKTCKELHCVQDADKLDAIGAFGIMRCSAYSAVSNRPLFAPESNSSHPSSCPNDKSSGSSDPDDDSRMTAFPPIVPEGSDAISHFHDKLVKLETMMKTDKGRQLAKVRTERLRQFIDWIESESDTTSL